MYDGDLWGHDKWNKLWKHIQKSSAETDHLQQYTTPLSAVPMALETTRGSVKDSMLGEDERNLKIDPLLVFYPTNFRSYS